MTPDNTLNNSDTALVDLTALADLKQLLGDALLPLVHDFEEQGDTSLAELDSLLAQEALEASHRQEAKDIVHLLKGSALSLHCARLHGDCEQFEQLCSAAPPSRLREQRQQLQGTLVATLQVLLQNSQ